jgi:hypothetical protein
MDAVVSKVVPEDEEARAAAQVQSRGDGDRDLGTDALAPEGFFCYSSHRLYSTSNIANILELLPKSSRQRPCKSVD